MPEAETAADLDACEALLGFFERGEHIDWLLDRLVGDREVATAGELAAAVGATESSIANGWKSRGMPFDRGGTRDSKYPLAPIVRWRVDDLKSQGRRAGPATVAAHDLKEQLAREELRKLQFQADRLEREEEMARGDLVKRSDVMRGWKQGNAELAEYLRSWPDQIAPQLPPKQRVELVEDFRQFIDRLLIYYAEGTPKKMGVS